MGNTEAADLLEEILDEEKAANESLTELARGGSNEEALGESDEEGSPDARNVRRSVRTVNTGRR